MQPETRAAPKGKARGVEEVEAVAALGHVDNVLAMQRVFRAGIGHVSIVVVHPGLPGTQTFMIVGESDLIKCELPVV